MEYQSMNSKPLKVFLKTLLEYVKKAKDLQEVIKHLEELIEQL